MVELLVVVAVLMILSVAVVTLYVSGVRANRAGRQAIDAQEESRAAFDVVERDLASAFTSRDYGKYYTFYGAPYGMMFVGLVRGEQDPEDLEGHAPEEQENLQRVTYILRRSDASPVFVKNADWEDGTEVITCALLRYIEPAVEDLDTFVMYDSSGTPLPWDEFVDGWSSEFPMLDGLLDYPSYGTVSGWAASDERRKVYGADSQAAYESIKEIRLAAKKRETWLKMLANFPDYPNGWAFLSPDGEEKNPNDYIVADNIVARYRTPKEREDELGVVPLDVSGADTFFFRYGRLVVDRIALEPASQWLESWDSEANVIDPVTGDVVGLVYLEPEETRAGPRNAAGSPLAGRLPQAVHMMMTFRYESPYVGAPDTIRKVDQVIDVPSGYTRSRL